MKEFTMVEVKGTSMYMTLQQKEEKIREHRRVPE